MSSNSYSRRKASGNAPRKILAKVVVINISTARVTSVIPLFNNFDSVVN